MPTCPVCEKALPEALPPFCDQCGWDLKSDLTLVPTLGGIDDATIAEYRQRLETAKTVWERQKALEHKLKEMEKRLAEARTRPKAEEKPPEPAKKPAPKGYSRHTPVPPLKRDPFETAAEYQERMKGYPPVPAGNATLLRDEYDIDTGRFPVQVEWMDWVGKMPDISKIEDPCVNAERDLARAIYESGPGHPVYARLEVSGQRAVISKVELVAGDQVLEVRGKGFEQERTDKYHIIRLGKEKVPMRFVYVPPGEFTMGSPEDEPGRDDDERQHKVILTEGFFMQETPVTQAQWAAVMGDNPSHFKKCGPDCPVESVSWDDAQRFLKKLNEGGGEYEYRLPTEAQWEYACRAGTTTRYYTGDSKADLKRAGWYGENSGDKTHPVGQKKPNAFGLYDMHGNVWEWCQDWFGDYPAGPVTDPTGPKCGSNRVLRGGGWYDNARYCRSADRYGYYPSFRGSRYGFRLALSPGR